MRNILLLPLLPLLIAASPATLRKQALTASDYPEAARMAGVEGDVALDLAVDAKGKITSCRVTAGAGLAENLGAQTCAVVQKRWQFKPAEDDAGQKIPASLRATIAWRIALPCPKADAQAVCVFL